MKVIVDELIEIRDQYGQQRRTEILEDEAEIQVEDLIQEEQMVVTISHKGYIKRTPLTTYRAQKRGGKGNRGMDARDDDFVNPLVICSTPSFVFFFPDRGKVFVKKVYTIPQAARNAKGRAIVNFVGLEDGEKIAAITPVEGFNEGLFVTTLTRRGQIKKTSVLDYSNYREKGIIGVKLADDDQLLGAAVTDGESEVLIATRSGKSIRFDEAQVRAMGRNTNGVKAIELAPEDEVVGLAVTEADRTQVLTVCARGYGKRTPLEDFRLQNRGGKGIILIDASERNGPVVGISLVKEGDEVMLMTDRGQTIRTTVSEIRQTGRNAQGVRVMNVSDGESVVAMESVGEEDIVEETPDDVEPGDTSTNPADAGNSTENAGDDDAEGTSDGDAEGTGDDASDSGAGDD